VPGRESRCWAYWDRSAETTLPFLELEQVSLQEGVSKKGLIHRQAIPVLTQTQMELTVPRHRSAEQLCSVGMQAARWIPVVAGCRQDKQQFLQIDRISTAYQREPCLRSAEWDAVVIAS